MNNKGDFFKKSLLKEIREDGKWISQNSAILVFHGIGEQKPFETLGTFVQGILKTYEKSGFDKTKFTITHDFIKHEKGDTHWYENIIKINYDNSPYYLDCYEFYWADKTEDKVSWSDAKDWVNTLVNGANKFYSRKKEDAKKYKDESVFFQNGEFKTGLYKTTLGLATVTIPLLGSIVNLLTNLLRFIPFVGEYIYGFLKSKENKNSKRLANIFGDIVAYNSPDPKNKLFKTRRAIQKEASRAIRHLIESKSDNINYRYDRVIVAAHSLGTQIAFDALNSVDHRVALGDIKRGNIKELLKFVTFGSHLDKAAFFFTEQTEEKDYIKAQIRNNFYDFKRAKNDKDKDVFKVENRLKSELSDIGWRNYYDINDPVSGELDYYDKVINIRCDYVASLPKKKGLFSCIHNYICSHNKENTLFYICNLYIFTHGCYWDDRRMYRDIIIDYLN